MSADTLARVDALFKKADELRDKGHLLRAAENFGRAADAARALGADNLVTVSMQLLGGNTRIGFVVAAPVATTDPRVLAVHRAECIALYSGAVEALERRRVAGTLLEGKCAAAEEAWFAGALQRGNVNLSAANAASWSALVGYAQFLRAASNVLYVLQLVHIFSTDCSNSQFQSFTQFVVHAAELMQQPRRHFDMAMQCEAAFTNELRNAVAECTCQRTRRAPGAAAGWRMAASAAQRRAAGAPHRRTHPV